MNLNGDNLPKRGLSWLRWASLLSVGLAAILWAGVAALSSTGAGPSGWISGSGAGEAVEPENLSQAFRSAAKRVLPAVVVIKTAKRTMADGEGDSSWPNSGHFAENEDFDGHPSLSQAEPVLGSGVMIDAQGIVLTNNHVVEGAEELVVRLADGRQFPATVDRTDSSLDLAVLRVKSNTSLPAAKLGDSDKREIGDWVLAIGSPFELEQTVSAGIISAKGRSLEAAGSARLLQTDAAVNPGSSGGPLVNLAGEVIGITTAIASRSGGYQGVAFAVPINLVKQLQSSRPKSGRSRYSRPGSGSELFHDNVRSTD